MTEKTTTEYLPPEQASLIIFLSFRHSQGDPFLQNDIFQYIHRLKPQWKVNAEQIGDIKQRSLQAAYNYLYPRQIPNPHHIEVDQEFLEEATESFVANLGQTLASKTEPDTNILNRISAFIIARDAHYLEGNDYGRKKHDSYFCRFGLEGKTTGAEVLDQVYRDVVKNIQKLITESPYHKSKHMINNIISIIDTYYEENSTEPMSPQAKELLKIANKIKQENEHAI